MVSKLRRRVAVGALMQEGNTFVPRMTTFEDFERYFVWRGEEMLAGYRGMRTEVPGFLSILEAEGVEVVPLTAAYCVAGGVLARGTFDRLVSEMEAALKAAGDVDGLLLALHGALVVDDQPDGDGEIIKRMRAILPHPLPIGVSLDLHGHITPLMLQPATFHVGYQAFPHIDMFETGQKTARMLLDAIETGSVPAMALAKRHMLISPTCTRTTDGPFVEFVDLARKMEAQGEAKCVSYFCVQPWIDVPDLGFAALVAGETQDLAQQAADKLADAVWAARNNFFPELCDVREAIEIGLASPGLTVVSDAGDAPTGGAAADSAFVLENLLAAGAHKANRLTYLTLCDPEGAALAHRIGIGGPIHTKVGHAFTPNLGMPIEIDGLVAHTSDGRFQIDDGGATGLWVDMGPTATIAIGAIRLVVRSAPAMEWDRGIYTSQGLILADGVLAFAKSPSHFRHSFGAIANRILVANTPGVTPPDMRRIMFRNVTRPLFPQDE
ncbi:M81 family peptidase [Mesorhizobium sp. M3A.F.Ca.ET.201.01.1.1]|uniref:M81 family metallopeptidase n=1 Tax=Mesorhizobium sp. M3A.F.Ca.ET.201.01.1.1 TaxID=2563946 RepID=UPI00109407D6|nr:M81 family metallopeptidase [Mesorhizobium sp. M3A.F.Ca.ET.201.01.1.1]TGS71742.1 M81 family peptidase [Mesorhizobium sp. M3A.F.Ca.ET.201.01.1.1]